MITSGFVTLLLVAPMLLVGVLLCVFVDPTAGLVFVGVSVAAVLLSAALAVVSGSAESTALSQRANAGFCAVMGVFAVGMAVWLARTGRPAAWFESLVALAAAVVYFARGWRQLRAQDF